MDGGPADRRKRVLMKGPETPRAEEGKPDCMVSRRLSLTPLWLLCSLWGCMGPHPMLHFPLPPGSSARSLGLTSNNYTGPAQLTDWLLWNGVLPPQPAGPRGWGSLGLPLLHCRLNRLSDGRGTITSLLSSVRNFIQLPATYANKNNGLNLQGFTFSLI